MTWSWSTLFYSRILLKLEKAKINKPLFNLFVTWTLDHFLSNHLFYSKKRKKKWLLKIFKIMYLTRTNWVRWTPLENIKKSHNIRWYKLKFCDNQKSPLISRRINFLDIKTVHCSVIFRCVKLWKQQFLELFIDYQKLRTRPNQF